MFAFFCNNKSSSHECSLNLFWIFWENKWHVSLRTFSICITNILFHWNCISLSFTACCLLFLDLIRLAACWECRWVQSIAIAGWCRLQRRSSQRIPVAVSSHSTPAIWSTQLGSTDATQTENCNAHFFLWGWKGCSSGRYRLDWPIHLPEAMPIYVNLSHAPHWTWLNFLAFASSILEGLNSEGFRWCNRLVEKDILTRQILMQPLRPTLCKQHLHLRAQACLQFIQL